MKKTSILLLLFALGLVGGPAVAAAQQVILYEVTETVSLKMAKRTGVRTANAALVGKAKSGSPICPVSLGADCDVIVNANDKVDLKTGKGSVHGHYSVVVQDLNTVDAAEVVVFRGVLSGAIDLSPAILSQIPLGTITGDYTGKGHKDGPVPGKKVTGSFTGTFRLPFADPGDPNTALYLMDPVLGSVIPVASAEHSLAFPTVRLEITLGE